MDKWWLEPKIYTGMIKIILFNFCSFHICSLFTEQVGTLSL